MNRAGWESESKCLVAGSVEYIVCTRLILLGQ